MKLLTLRIKALGVFRDPFEIPLDRGLILVEGPNGVGKSLLIESIGWIAFGKLPRYGNGKIGADEVINEETGLADGALEFEDVHGNRYCAHRYRKRTGSAKFDLTVYRDGEWKPLEGVAADVVRATGDLSTLLGFDYDTLRYALFLTGTGLTLASAGYGGQMAALESALRFDLFSRSAEFAVEDRKRLQTEEVVLKSEIVAAQNDKASSRHAIESMETLDESDRERELREEIAALEADLLNEASARDAAKSALEEIEFAVAAVAQALQSYNTASDDVQFFTDLQTSKKYDCPTCHAVMSDARITELVALYTERMANAQAEIATAEGKEADAREAGSAALAAMAAVEAAKKAIGPQRRELSALVERKTRRQGVLQQEQARFEAAEQREATAQDKLLAIQADLFDATVWQKGYSNEGLKQTVMVEAAPVLNMAALKFGDLLTDGKIGLEFNPLRASRTEDITRITVYGRSLTYKGCSSGEKRMVDVIIALSLREVARWRMGQTLNIAAWDEVFDPLDEESLRRVVQVLQMDMDQLDCVFVVTHNPVFKALFPGARILRVSSEGGVSHVEWA